MIGFMGEMGLRLRSRGALREWRKRGVFYKRSRRMAQSTPLARIFSELYDLGCSGRLLFVRIFFDLGEVAPGPGTPLRSWFLFSRSARLDPWLAEGYGPAPSAGGRELQTRGGQVETKVAQGLTRSPSSALSHPFLGKGSPTEIDCRKEGALFLSSTGGPS